MASAFIPRRSVGNALAWTAGIVSGFAAAVLGRGSGRGPVVAAVRGRGRRSRRWLLRTVMGCSMRDVLVMLGPPPTTTVPSASAQPGRAGYWNAKTWYYPWDTRARAAVAIRFDRGVACRIELVYAP
jgi:hypothetical protein